MVEKVAFLSIKTQFDNLGDALINREMARASGERVRTYIDLSRCPDSFARMMGVDSIPGVTLLRERGYVRLLWRVLLERSRGNSCYFMLNPGGLGPKKNSKQRFSALMYNGLLSIFAKLGVNVCQVGVSFDKMQKTDLKLTRYRASLMHSFVVRDPVSYDYLKSENVKVVGVVPDLSFNLYTNRKIRLDERSIVAFSFRFDSSGLGDVARVASHLKEIAYLIGDKYEFLFISQVRRDSEPLLRLKQEMANELPRFKMDFVECVESIDEAIAIYSQVKFIFSNRLHALLLAAYSGAVPYALIDPNKNRKIVSLFESIGLEQQLLDVGSDCLKFDTNKEFPFWRLESQASEVAGYFDKLLCQRQEEIPGGSR